MLPPAHRTARPSRDLPGRARRGTALVAALFTIAVLTTVTATVSVQSRSSAGFAVNQRRRAVARLMAESGILAAQAQLAAELQRGLGMGSPDSSGLDAVWDAVARRERAPDATAWVADTLGDGLFEAAVVNVSARLDVNTADAAGLEALFRTVAPVPVARRVADAVAARVRGERAGAADPTADWREADRLAERDSLMRALLGRDGAPRARRPLQSLDELPAVAGPEAAWLAEVADQLTVDGDGRIDRRHASAAVRSAATGALVDRPTRVLLVARGRQVGHPIAREIQAVYEVAGATLTLVHWREMDR